MTSGAETGRGKLCIPARRFPVLPCPILIAICDQDSLAVPAAAEATARRAGKRATVNHYPIGHFDIYLGEWFERSVTDQVVFLQEALARLRHGRRAHLHRDHPMPLCGEEPMISVIAGTKIPFQIVESRQLATSACWAGIVWDFTEVDSGHRGDKGQLSDGGGMTTTINRVSE